MGEGVRSTGAARGGGSEPPSYPGGLSAGWAPGTLPPPVPAPMPGVERTPDFSAIDFVRLWAGRGRVTEVEGRILLEALSGIAPGRVLEIGTGGGRLTPYLASWTRDIVASDATASLLRALHLPDDVRAPRVAANVYHLPFVDGCFAAATLVRVFGFLTDPAAALRELHRVLRPGGALLLSFEPHPSLGSLLDDLKIGLARTPGDVPPRMTFGRAPVVPVRPSAYPAWSSSRDHLRALVEGVGFLVDAEYPCGLEDLAGLRRLPASAFVGLAKALSKLGGFPTRFLRLIKQGPTETAST